MSAAQTIELCNIDDIENPGSRGFEVDAGGTTPLRLFVVRKGNLLAAYRNRCPHTGAPLEWQPHQFMDIDNSFVQCAIHGALFRPEDGYCLRGPCVGQSLAALDVNVSNDRLSVTLPLEERQEPLNPQGA
jgi:nitrite reductase/ring-hydroxylating ferredoxin subunit